MSKKKMLEELNRWEERVNAYHYAQGLINLDLNAKPPVLGMDSAQKKISLLIGESFAIEYNPEIYNLLLELDNM